MLLYDYLKKPNFQANQVFCLCGIFQKQKSTLVCTFATDQIVVFSHM